MTINTKHPLYLSRFDQWRLIEDITTLENLSGYLRTLNPLDTSAANKRRNAQYHESAVFYPIAQNTAQGMIGSIFRKWPSLAVPDELLYLADNADGEGNSIYQSSQGACDDVLRKGRAGISVSFPQTEGEVSRADIVSGKVVATIHRYTAEQIINWRVEQDGANARLTLVVTREEMDKEGFEPYLNQTETVYREMYLDYVRDEQGLPVSADKVYQERIWKESENKILMISQEYIPLDAQGKTWERIPFMFIGSENNDSTPDMPPMFGLCKLNIGHYRNSADYEDSVWYNGQAQAWMSGVDQNHIDLMKDNKMYVGSRELLAVPSGEQFGFAQPAPNTMVKEAMDAKIDAMIMIGARLMQPGSATKTATQAAADQDAQTSVLAMVASNVSEAYTQAVKWVCRYMGVKDDEVAYTLSQEFVQIGQDPQLLTAMVASFLQGAIPAPDFLRWTQKVGYVDTEKTIEEFLEETTQTTMPDFDA